MYEIVNVQYTGTYNNAGTSIPAVLGEFRASSAADLPAQNVDCHIICGCDGLDIATGDKYIWNGTAWVLQPSDRAFSNVYTKPEIDSMVTAIYQTMMYYHTEQQSDDGTITFYTLGGNVGSLAIYGNGQQNGTPSPYNIIIPDFCGTLDGTDWTIPITCAGQTVPVYLGQTQTVRKIRKLVLTGEENWQRASGTMYLSELAFDYKRSPSNVTYICSHYGTTPQVNSAGSVVDGTMSMAHDSNNQRLYIRDTAFSSAADFKSYIATQYAAGNPVTVWYVLAEPTTGIVNEPLAKIGDYADELHSTDAGVSIPTVKGQNTLTVDTELPPCKIIISGER